MFPILGSVNITMAHIQRIARLENGSKGRLNTIKSDIGVGDAEESLGMSVAGTFTEKKINIAQL